MLKRIILSIFVFFVLAQPATAVVDPRISPNNKFGIDVVVPSAQMNDAATLVNTNGDWGYIVIVVTKNERDLEKMQSFLNQANEKHIIPIIRLATRFDPSLDYWEKPEGNDSQEWANFLSQLYFPTKNKYIQLYNEVNRASEWGGFVDPSGYAREIQKTADALKAKSGDFFILNAPLDLSLPTSNNSLEAEAFFNQMQAEVSGIFDKIDGLASHSYPNPAFSASPQQLGRTGIDGYAWELSQISQYSSKNFPVFITETGWRRSSLLGENQISEYYKQAFENVWNDSRVVAVAPFVLSYPQEPFAQFSFAKDNNGNYYSYFDTIRSMTKVKGDPKRDSSILIKSIEANGIFQRLGGFTEVKIKNTGNYILTPSKELMIKTNAGGVILGGVDYDKDKLYPGEELTAMIDIKNIASKDVEAKIIISDKNKTLAEREITISNQNLVILLSAKIKTISASFRL